MQALARVPARPPCRGGAARARASRTSAAPRLAPPPPHAARRHPLPAAMRRATTPPACAASDDAGGAAASSSPSPASAGDAANPALPPPEPRHTLLGVEADLVAIVLVYFVQGALGLSRLAVSFFLKDELHLDPSQLALLTGAASAPWLVKPLWGFLSDSVPLFGYRRRSYLVLCGGLGAAGWSALAAPGLVHTPGAALAALLATSLATAASDVVVDSLVVERARGEAASAAGGLQSLCWGSAAVGGIASAYFSGSLVELWGPRAVFGLTAAFPLLTAAVAPLVRDAPAVAVGFGAGAAGAAGAAGTGAAAPNSVSVSAQAGRLWAAARTRAIWLPAAFLFIWQASPSPDAALFYFTTSQLGFTPEFLGRARLAGALASLAGVSLYNARLKNVPIKRIFRATSLIGFALGLTQLILVTGANRRYGISDQLFALSDTVVLTVLGQVAFMPTLVLAARICPAGIEATLFAALMSVFNAAGVASGAAGAALTSALHVGTGGSTAADFENLPLLIVICNVLGLLPLPFLYLLDEVPGLADAEEAHAKAQSAEGEELLERDAAAAALPPGAAGGAHADGHKSD
jgi:folate/biopterin transporter